MARKIRIFDTTLRDGEQSPGASMNIEEKLEVAKQLARLKVDVIEAGFPISSPGDFEAVKAVAQNVKGPAVAGLCRASAADIDRAWEALQYAKKPVIHLFIATSDIHLEKKLRKSREEVLEIAIANTKRAKGYCEEVEFSAEDASRSDFDYLCQVVEAVIDAGATVINLPDTVGYAIPSEYGEMIRRVIERVPNSKKAVFSVHCHNDLGLAVANSLAAVVAGAGQVECTINGIGERAGNAALEEVVMAINTRADLLGVTTGHQHQRDLSREQAGHRRYRAWRCRSTRPSWAATRSRTRPASISTACCRTNARMRSWTRRPLVWPRASWSWASIPAGTRSRTS